MTGQNIWALISQYLTVHVSVRVVPGCYLERMDLALEISELRV